MRLRARLPVALILLWLSVISPIASADTSVELTVFFSPICTSCEMVKSQVLAPLAEAYGDKLTLIYVDVSQADGLGQLEDTERRLGQLDNPLPVIVLGDQLIASEDIFEIEDQLKARLAELLGPAPELATAATPSAGPPTVSPSPTAVPSEMLPLHIAYVEKEGCESCARAFIVLQALKTEYPNMIVATFNHVRDADLVEAMGVELGLPSNRRLIAPSIYVGDDVLVGDQITSGSLRPLLVKYSATGSPAFWDALDTEAGSSSIVGRFRAMGPLAVVLAALIDGINPCAFATIIFFVSYLAITRRQRGALLAIGLAFTAGVFVAYSLIGLGAMSLIKFVHTFRNVGAILYGLMALGCFVLAGLSVHDYTLARQGRLHEMHLNLPDSLREKIKGRIRATSGAFVGVAFVSGLVVSLLELACTGQVYLPTISFVVGIPQMRIYAIAYLAIYNLVFVLPLLAVLLLTVYGVSAARFQDWFVSNAAKTKLIMALLFLVLGGLLLSQVISL